VLAFVSGFPIPETLAYGLWVLQLLGGAALAVGLLTRTIALLFAEAPNAMLCRRGRTQVTWIFSLKRG
jgi:uncharacterized membrane protein YphA (DoxX/SURF4 family)